MIKDARMAAPSRLPCRRSGRRPRCPKRTKWGTFWVNFSKLMAGNWLSYKQVFDHAAGRSGGIQNLQKCALRVQDRPLRPARLPGWLGPGGAWTQKRTPFRVVSGLRARGCGRRVAGCLAPVQVHRVAVLNSTARIKTRAFVPLGARCARFGCLFDVESCERLQKECCFIQVWLSAHAGWSSETNRTLACPGR